MKQLASLIVALTISLAIVWQGHARNIKQLLPIAGALESTEAQGKLDGSVKFFFGKEKTREGVKTLRNDVALGKVSLRGKSDDTACNSAFLSALAELQKRAKQHGADAVVNVVSYYKRVEMSSPTQFECHEGSGYMAVALRGDFVKAAEK
jgi:uncharacterized protein YbjQ (UPF0145 family)